MNTRKRERERERKRVEETDGGGLKEKGAFFRADL